MAIAALPLLLALALVGCVAKYAYRAWESGLIDKIERRQCHNQCHYGDKECAARCSDNHFCPAEMK